MVIKVKGIFYGRGISTFSNFFLSHLTSTYPDIMLGAQFLSHIILVWFCSPCFSPKLHSRPIIRRVFLNSSGALGFIPKPCWHSLFSFSFFYNSITNTKKDCWQFGECETNLEIFFHFIEDLFNFLKKEAQGLQGRRGSLHHNLIWKFPQACQSFYLHYMHLSYFNSHSI